MDAHSTFMCIFDIWKNVSVIAVVTNLVFCKVFEQKPQIQYGPVNSDK
jgi:hypothetical protein